MTVETIRRAAARFVERVDVGAAPIDMDTLALLLQEGPRLGGSAHELGAAQ